MNTKEWETYAIDNIDETTRKKILDFIQFKKELV
jgi:hypothetical protein